MINFLLNPYVSGIIVFLLTLPASYLYSLFMKRNVIRNANVKVVDSMLAFMISMNKYDSKILSHIIKSTAYEEKIPVKKLLDEQNYISLLVNGLLKNIYLPKEEKENLIDLLLKKESNTEIDELLEGLDKSITADIKRLKYLNALIIIYVLFLIIFVIFWFQNKNLVSELYKSKDFYFESLPAIVVSLFLGTKFLDIIKIKNKTLK
ncbi:hypothetical protein CW689_05470 [Macrococcoides caseolyticum]|uniref:hypothetical protein n=1 Tax=Macrococcoides caseolyticum TaxID=69966 RepID=UPI000C33C775|nr:hypothetical protein [Macrococcus caseolyticus]PKE24162.1 hypothetical protein CW689_05470 [Macrococcus caseolyticus]